MDRRTFNLGLLGLGGMATLSSLLQGCSTGGGSASRISGIDTHAHVFHRNLPFVPNRRYTPHYDATPQEFIEQIQHNGLSHGVIIPISILGTNNDYTIGNP